MPLRSDPSLWWNLPGVVAAYQPVRAPDSLSARYNMAHGGDARYRADPGTLPAWSAVAGWSFNGMSQYLTTKIVPDSTFTAILRYSNSTVDYGDRHLWTGSFTAPVFDLGGRWHSAAILARWGDGNSHPIVEDTSRGVQCLAGNRHYWNGVMVGTSSGTWSGTPTGPLRFDATGGAVFMAQSALIVSRTLSPAEVWNASRQMQYCDVNPDWSVWSRRRQWYYGPLVAAAYQRRQADVGRVGSRGVSE